MAAGDKNLEKDSSTPIGHRNKVLEVSDESNKPITINGRDYSGHALNRMQGQGITVTVEENALVESNLVKGKYPGTTAYHDLTNKLTVIIDTASGKVVIVDHGIIKQ